MALKAIVNAGLFREMIVLKRTAFAQIRSVRGKVKERTRLEVEEKWHTQSMIHGSDMLGNAYLYRITI